MNSTSLYSEKKIAERLSLTRDDLRYIRREILKRPGGWDIAGNRVVLTSSGLAAVLTRLRKTLHQPFEGIDFGDCRLTSAAEKKEAATELLDLKVVRLFPNPKFLLAASADERPLRVRVADNKNFRRGMAFKARLRGDGDYELEGRCPRYPGRF